MRFGRAAVALALQAGQHSLCHARPGRLHVPGCIGQAVFRQPLQPWQAVQYPEAPLRAHSQAVHPSCGCDQDQSVCGAACFL